MKKVKSVSLLLVCMILIYGISINALASSITDTVAEFDRDTPDFDGLFPSFTQKDYDADFRNYAMDSSVVDLSGGSSLLSVDGISNAVGTVFDNVTEEPVRNATVTVCDSETNEVIISINTDDNGRFQIWGLEDGIYNWTIEHQGYEIAHYNGYDVCAGDITSIFTFYMSCDVNINKEAHEHLHVEDEVNVASENASNVEERISLASFTAAPELSSFTVGVNGVAKTVERYTYLCYVVASEALGYYQCTGYGMSDTQIKQYYAAQAVASNTFLEWAAVGHSTHSGYTVCDSSHCQRYDTTKTTEFVISAVSTICYRIAGDWYSNIQVHKSGNSYNYIYGAYFAHCDGATVSYPGSSQPALKSVSCTNIDGNNYLSGNGWGFCQYGAAYKAKQGSSWLDILGYYYTSSTSLVCPHP